MKRFFVILVTAIMIFAFGGCGCSSPELDISYVSGVEYPIDYGDAESFEAALNMGVSVEGKVVRFVVGNCNPNSTFGYNLIAGEHLNFVYPERLDAHINDTMTVMVTSVKNVLGSWIIDYVQIDGAMTNNTITKDDIEEISIESSSAVPESQPDTSAPAAAAPESQPDTPAPAAAVPESQSGASAPAVAASESQPDTSAPAAAAPESQPDTSAPAAGTNEELSGAESYSPTPPEAGRYVVNGKNGKIHINGGCGATKEGSKTHLEKPVYFDTYEEAEAYSIQINPTQTKRECGNCF